MKLRTFTAPDMPSAMKMVREAMGDEAVIVSTITDKAKKQVRITAAYDQESFTPRETAETVHKRTQLQAWVRAMEDVLRFHNTPSAIIRKLMSAAHMLQLDSMLTLQKLASSASSAQLEARILAQVLDNCFSFDSTPLVQNGDKLMLVGPPGAGKTLSIAKLATRLSVSNTPFSVITCDTKRAGGIEQLAAFTDILGLSLEIAANASELGNIVQRLPASHIALIDTAGCNPFEGEDLLELKLMLTFSGIQPVLTLPAGMDSEEAADYARYFSMPSLKRLLITRADAARRYGSLLAAADASNLAFSHFSGGHRVVGELSPLDATSLAQMLLQHTCKAS